MIGGWIVVDSVVIVVIVITTTSLADCHKISETENTINKRSR
jgi:hypothetical protein